VVIVSSDEEEDAAENKSNSNLSTRTSSFQDELPSSQPSSDSLFSHVSIGSSVDSLGTSVSKLQFKDSINTTQTIIHDIFNPVPQPNNLSTDSSPTEIDPVLRFARSPFGTDLEVMVIAHSRKAQKLFDDNHIAWGVQYEIARGVCSGLWTWDGVESQVPLLRGKNSEATFKVERVMKGRGGLKPSDMHIWYSSIFPYCQCCSSIILIGGNLTLNKKRFWRTLVGDLVPWVISKAFGTGTEARSNR